MSDQYHPLPPEACPCGRPHPELYRDPACEAARYREHVVRQAAVATSREIEQGDRARYYR